MFKKILEKLGTFVGRPITLSHKENSQLRKDGVMKAYEVAWASPDGRYWYIRNNKTSELRVVTK